MIKFSDLMGKKFNSLTIIDTVKVKEKNQSRMYVVCECVCGNITRNRLQNLKRGTTKSCGCSRIVEDAGFKFILRKTKTDTRKIFCDLTLDDLKEKWEQQKGICVYSGIKLVLPVHSNKPNPAESYKMASLDRVDSSKFYTKDNIQFVSRNINYAKNNMSHEQTLEFIKEIREAKKESTFLVDSF